MDYQIGKYRSGKMNAKHDKNVNNENQYVQKVHDAPSVGGSIKCIGK